MEELQTRGGGRLAWAGGGDSDIVSILYFWCVVLCSVEERAKMVEILKRLKQEDEKGRKEEEEEKVTEEGLEQRIAGIDLGLFMVSIA